jgi:hypothetical protein
LYLVGRGPVKRDVAVLDCAELFEKVPDYLTSSGVGQLAEEHRAIRNACGS